MAHASLRHQTQLTATPAAATLPGCSSTLTVCCKGGGCAHQHQDGEGGKDSHLQPSPLSKQSREPQAAHFDQHVLAQHLAWLSTSFRRNQRHRLPGPPAAALSAAAGPSRWPAAPQCQPSAPDPDGPLPPPRESARHSRGARAQLCPQRAAGSQQWCQGQMAVPLG